MKLEEPTPRTLEVTGAGAVEVAPDVATVTLAVITEAKTAAEAVERNAATMTAVTKAVEALPHGSIRTTGLGVAPITVWDADTRSSTITGFRADNGIAVETKVDGAGAIFDAGVTAGANQSSGITFGLRDERPHREEALRIAVKEAHADASVVATTADAVLLGPERIEVDPAAAPAVRTLELARSEVATPVMPGALRISARVRMVFRYRPQ
ncbi:MAG: SIMPL domain-containing protein [Myxococcales bacterium]|nr:SIMPL domain-containing protein [Myxococcales bacterium]